MRRARSPSSDASSHRLHRGQLSDGDGEASDAPPRQRPRTENALAPTHRVAALLARARHAADPAARARVHALAARVAAAQAEHAELEAELAALEAPPPPLVPAAQAALAALEARLDAARAEGAPLAHLGALLEAAVAHRFGPPPAPSPSAVLDRACALLRPGCAVDWGASDADAVAAVAAGLTPAAARLRVRATVGPAAGRVFSLADLTACGALGAAAFGAHYVATLEATVAALGVQNLAACASGAAGAAALPRAGVREAARLFSEGRAFVVAWVATDVPTTHRVALQGPAAAAFGAAPAASSGSDASAATTAAAPAAATAPAAGPACGLPAALDILALTRPQRAAVAGERRGLFAALRAARAAQAAAVATLRAAVLARGPLDARAFGDAVTAAAALAAAVRAEGAAMTAFCARVGGVLTPTQGGVYTALSWPRAAACDALAEAVALADGEPPAAALLAGAA